MDSTVTAVYGRGLDNVFNHVWFQWLVLKVDGHFPERKWPTFKTELISGRFLMQAKKERDMNL